MISFSDILFIFEYLPNVVPNLLVKLFPDFKTLLVKNKQFSFIVELVSNKDHGPNIFPFPIIIPRIIADG